MDSEWLFLLDSDWLFLLVLGWLFQADSNKGTATSFTPLEFKLLKLLSLNPNTVLTRQHLLYSLWDRNGNYVEETSLNSMICRIRQRIDTENHHYIKTIYGIGYMWSTY